MCSYVYWIKRARQIDEQNPSSQLPPWDLLRKKSSRHEKKLVPRGFLRVRARTRARWNGLSNKITGQKKRKKNSRTPTPSYSCTRVRAGYPSPARLSLALALSCGEWRRLPQPPVAAPPSLATRRWRARLGQRRRRIWLPQSTAAAALPVPNRRHPPFSATKQWHIEARCAMVGGCGSLAPRRRGPPSGSALLPLAPA